jgi:general stress protein 26
MTREAGLSREDLLRFMQSQTYAVEASVSGSGAPEAAVVGIVVTNKYEVVFDTLESTRKVPNLRRNPRIALVIGGMAPGDERTVQYEGLADEPTGSELERLKRVYFERFPDGREREAWPGIVYVRVRPSWVRYSDYGRNPALIVEFTGNELTSRP